MVILLFGPPGCGKGTQACEIVGLTQITAISMGDLLRGEMKAGSELGKRVQGIMLSGGLVSDQLVNELMVSRISRPDCRHGFLLDGYPRTVEQARFLDGVLAGRGYGPPIVFHLDVPADVVVGRITARRQCSNCNRIYNTMYQPPKQDGVCDFDGAALFTRKDDNEEVVRERMRTYEKLTGPVLNHYRSGDYHRVDGVRPYEQVFADIAAVLQPEMVGESS